MLSMDEADVILTSGPSETFSDAIRSMWGSESGFLSFSKTKRVLEQNAEFGYSREDRRKANGGRRVQPKILVGEKKEQQRKERIDLVRSEDDFEN